jgi:hypothetical protein
MTTHNSHDLTASGQAARDPVIVPLAVLLWVVVIAGLVYGVVSTLDKVVALFS